MPEVVIRLLLMLVTQEVEPVVESEAAPSDDTKTEATEA